VAVRPAALVSDEKCIRGVYARCAIQIDTFAFYDRQTDREECVGVTGIACVSDLESSGL